MYFNDGPARAKQADMLLQAREQARVHEALLERGGRGEQNRFRFFARLGTAFQGRTKLAGQAPEALSSACARARRLVSLSLDGGLADYEHRLLSGHLEDCAACSSFQELSGAATAMLRGTLPAQPGRAFDLSQLVRVTRKVNGMPVGSEGTVGTHDTRNPGEVIVRFWDGGPLGVPGDALARIEHRRPASGEVLDLPELASGVSA